MKIWGPDRGGHRRRPPGRDVAGRLYPPIDPIHRFLARVSGDRDDGQSLAEFAIILALIAIVAIVSIVFLGDVIASLMSAIGSTIDEQTL